MAYEGEDVQNDVCVVTSESGSLCGRERMLMV